MSCYQCKCNLCARSAELGLAYFTPGEIQNVEDICYTCDECTHWSGDWRRRSQWREECPGYVEPKKLTEAHALCARQKFTVIDGRRND
jgi:hypothetical protein